MQTECNAEPSLFGRVEGRPVVAESDGGPLTSDAGGLLLGAADRRLNLVGRLAGCFRDARDPRFVEHSVATLVGQRVFGIALGYEDLNDHDELRHDPAMAVLAGKLEARREDCAPAAGKSTPNRLELFAACAHPPPEDRPRPGGDRGAVRRTLPRGSRPGAKADRARPRRHRRPAARPSGRPVLPRLAIAACRSTCSAAGVCWRPGSGPRTSTEAPDRSRRWRGSSRRSGRAGRGRASFCAPIPASAARR